MESSKTPGRRKNYTTHTHTARADNTGTGRRHAREGQTLPEIPGG